MSRQLKQRNFDNFILAIRKGNTTTTMTREINTVLQQYYETLCTPDTYLKKEELAIFFNHMKLPKLSPERAELLGGPMTGTEIREVILSTKYGKLPGIHGFPVEFYKQFIDILVPKLKEVYNEAYTLRVLPLLLMKL